jgi:KR domain
MVRRGAKNLILTSRFGPKNETANSFLQELRDQGVHVEVPACDISNLHLFRSVLAELTQKMPLIKGCFQSSMLLRVSKISVLFEVPADYS